MPEETNIESRNINAIEKDVNTVLNRMGGDNAKDRVARNSINDLMKEEYDKFVQDQKQAYLDSLNSKREQEAKDNNREFKKLGFDDLDAMQIIEADNYRFSDEEKKKYLESTFDKTKEIIYARNDYLNGDLITKDGGTRQERKDNGVISQLKKLEEELARYQEKIDKFDSLTARIDEVQGQLNSGEITEEQSKEMLKSLEDEKKQLDVELAPIDQTRKKVKELQEKIGNKIRKTISDHELAKKNAIDVMGLMYGDELVYSLDDGERNIDDIAPKGKLNQEYLDKKNKILNKVPQEKDENEDDNSSNDGNEERDLETEEKDNNSAKTTEPNVDQVNNNDVKEEKSDDSDKEEKSNNAEKKVVNGNVVQEVVQPISYLDLLGYDSSKKLNVSRAEDILNRFLADENKDNQLEMLKDPEASKVVMDSMKKISKNINPLKCKEIREIQKKLLSTGSLKEQVAMLYENNGEVTSYEQLKEEYTKGKDGIYNEIEKVKLTKGEDSLEYQDMVDKVNSLKAVMDFEDVAKKNFEKGSWVQGGYNNIKNYYYNGNAKLFLKEPVNNEENTISNSDVESKQNSNFMIEEYGAQGVYNKSDKEVKEYVEKVRSESLDSLVADIDAQEKGNNEQR